MGIFTKKPSFEDIIGAIDTLSEDEISRLKEKLTPTESQNATEPEATEEDGAPSTENGTSNEAENIENDGNRESENEDSENEDEEEEQPTEPRTEENTEPANESAPEDESNSIAAIAARLNSMEERFATLTERYEALVESIESKPFGNEPPGAHEGKEQPPATEDSRIMRSYMAKQTYRK